MFLKVRHRISSRQGVLQRYLLGPQLESIAVIIPSEASLQLSQKN